MQAPNAAAAADRLVKKVVSRNGSISDDTTCVVLMLLPETPESVAACSEEPRQQGTVPTFSRKGSSKVPAKVGVERGTLGSWWRLQQCERIGEVGDNRTQG